MYNHQPLKFALKQIFIIYKLKELERAVLHCSYKRTLIARFNEIYFQTQTKMPLTKGAFYKLLFFSVIRNGKPDDVGIAYDPLRAVCFKIGIVHLIHSLV